MRKQLERDFIHKRCDRTSWDLHWVFFWKIMQFVSPTSFSYVYEVILFFFPGDLIDKRESSRRYRLFYFQQTFNVDLNWCDHNPSERDLCLIAFSYLTLWPSSSSLFLFSLYLISVSLSLSLSSSLSTWPWLILPTRPDLTSPYLTWPDRRREAASIWCCSYGPSHACHGWCRGH